MASLDDPYTARGHAGRGLIPEKSWRRCQDRTILSAASQSEDTCHAASGLGRDEPPRHPSYQMAWRADIDLITTNRRVYPLHQRLWVGPGFAVGNGEA